MQHLGFQEQLMGFSGSRVLGGLGFWVSGFLGFRV